jgi:uncharacterized protein YgbK (DUF1537 family)
MSPAQPPPKVAFYGDDFTGATDTLGTAARAGLRSMLFLGVPGDSRLARAGALECLGIAGAARSMHCDEMRAELAPVATFFARLAAPLLHYKVCSTFDSSPSIGNMAVAIDALRPAAPNPLVAIVGGQPNLGRYCVFGNLFASAGADGPVHRIDRHPTMSRHPVTPMDEADLRRHLAAQGLMHVAALDYRAYEQGSIDAALDALLGQRPDAVLFDVKHPHDLAVLGRALWPRAQRQRMLAVGGSSVLQALAAQWRAGESEAPVRVAAANGPVFVLSGSLSPVTAAQVEHARSYRHLALDARRLAARDHTYIGATAEAAAGLLGSGVNVLAVARHESDDRARAGLSARAVAAASGELVAAVLARARVRRIGICGGDTSSHVIRATGAWGLSYAAQLTEGVALCRLHADDAALDGVEAMLKGGQMGPPGILDDLVHGVH